MGDLIERCTIHADGPGLVPYEERPTEMVVARAAVSGGMLTRFGWGGAGVSRLSSG